MEQNEMTIKDALMVAYNELCGISIPAEQTFSIGVHVGKALMILKDCIDSIVREEHQKPEESTEEKNDA